MDELTKAFPKAWCPNCNKVQPMAGDPMDEREDNPRLAVH
jgi:hypothetical protein